MGHVTDILTSGMTNGLVIKAFGRKAAIRLNSSVTTVAPAGALLVMKLTNVAALVGHWFVVFALGYINGTTMAANWRVIPAARFEERPCSFLIWELLEELESAKRI